MVDVNDNAPQFVFPTYAKLFSKEKYFGAVAKDKKEQKTVLQVKVRLIFCDLWYYNIIYIISADHPPRMG